MGCALAAPPDGLEITEMPEGVAAELVPGIGQTRPDLPWVGAVRNVALEFARAWVTGIGGDWHVRHDWMNPVSTRSSRRDRRRADCGWPGSRIGLCCGPGRRATPRTRIA